jgi:hypothetical protein
LSPAAASPQQRGQLKDALRHRASKWLESAGDAAATAADAAAKRAHRGVPGRDRGDRRLLRTGNAVGDANREVQLPGRGPRLVELSNEGSAEAGLDHLGCLLDYCGADAGLMTSGRSSQAR